MGKAILRVVACTAALGSALLFAQSKPQASASGYQEFPVTMRQNVIAGKTTVGTKVEAKLTAATFVDGTVIPVGAIFSGEVIESAAKSATDPSRLALRMDSVQWKAGSKPVTVYLTSWYYPIVTPERRESNADDEDASDGPPVTPSSRPPLGRVMISKNPTPQPTPPGPPPRSGVPHPTPANSNVSARRVTMKDVDSKRSPDGTLAIASTHVNIKLDKSTTYVLATADPVSTK